MILFKWNCRLKSVRWRRKGAITGSCVSVLRSPVSFRATAVSQFDFQRRWAGPAALKICCPWRQWAGRRCCPWRRHTCLTPCALSFGSRCTIKTNSGKTTGHVFELHRGHVTTGCFNVWKKLKNEKIVTTPFFLLNNAWKKSYVIFLVAILFVHARVLTFKDVTTEKKE